MENRFYIKELDSYQKASDLSKERMGTNPNYDLELLPTKQMQEEMWEFLQYRGKNLVAEKFYTERRFYHYLCRMLKEKNNRPESFLDWDKEKWMQQMKIWLLQQGLSLTAPFKNKCGGRGTQRARTLGYIECLIDYFARLLGHKSLKNVKYYRKMSNQILPNDTRKARNRLSQMVLECLDGWEEEYEQIRYDDSL